MSKTSLELPKLKLDQIVSKDSGNFKDFLQTRFDKELLSETKIEQVLKAKRELNERNDVVYYISADDLLKIQEMKSNIYIKLSIDSINITESPKKSPISSPKRSSISSPKRSPKGDISERHSPKSDYVRKTSHRSFSAGSGERHKLSPYTTTSANPTPQYKTQTIEMNKKTYALSGEKSDTLYSTFIIEQQSTISLMCKGLSDAEVMIPLKESFQTKQFVLMDYEFQMLTKSLDEFPIYVHILTPDKLSKTETIVDMFHEMLEF